METWKAFLLIHDDSSVIILKPTVYNENRAEFLQFTYRRNRDSATSWQTFNRKIAKSLPDPLINESPNSQVVGKLTCDMDLAPILNRNLHIIVGLRPSGSNSSGLQTHRTRRKCGINTWDDSEYKIGSSETRGNSIENKNKVYLTVSK